MDTSEAAVAMSQARVTQGGTTQAPTASRRRVPLVTPPPHPEGGRRGRRVHAGGAGGGTENAVADAPGAGRGAASLDESKCLSFANASMQTYGHAPRVSEWESVMFHMRKQTVHG
ncbi:hypothetical protein CYMTET_18447 [Cymbomonas tetramitiformis]|uniref:Uncharacterized protein n=1 Tax=Cymbomonas tetramitiformis TaxID=36881 RepID=A0AAE0L683_9CHLO|nr:hypothetical protein CYMTET_18447 [Cymbomonas tetramitiformis]